MKFYGFVGPTFYVSTDGGATFTSTNASGLPPAGTSAQFKAVPGYEGDIWLVGGSTTTVYGVWHSTNNGAAFTKLSNVQAASTIGFGMPAPKHTYPAIYSSAEVNSTGASTSRLMAARPGRVSTTTSTNTH